MVNNKLTELKWNLLSDFYVTQREHCRVLRFRALKVSMLVPFWLSSRNAVNAPWFTYSKISFIHYELVHQVCFMFTFPIYSLSARPSQS